MGVIGVKIANIYGILLLSHDGLRKSVISFSFPDPLSRSGLDIFTGLDIFMKNKKTRTENIRCAPVT
ncbi:hypothetical protein A2673_02215 [Candidatus Kaiserbacteria bacterium RIFCSPHIGHO2_01_FULL_50_13]|nr:MAG: hypothetical protein A2673_02215 [Candidatus Kaiserbacteria bacterium RIFCSPHIGHO2_01_FULL_50_13]OGG82368.1 MAG: hypothetical protein A3H74_00165 [Candidatus Kaiserbacteria bacterium RIFCSPLOWO2_02_FULL_51_13]